MKMLCLGGAGHNCHEYAPDLAGRVVFENGGFRQVPPFARPRDVALPAPYGTAPQYIIPHAETRTLAKARQSKGVRLMEGRGGHGRRDWRGAGCAWDVGRVGPNEASCRSEPRTHQRLLAADQFSPRIARSLKSTF
jgi:hypothetical protein